MTMRISFASCWNSVTLAVVAFIIGRAIAAVPYEITAAGAQIPIPVPGMTWPNLLLVLALTAAVCVLSGVAAVRRAYRADPAELF